MEICQEIITWHRRKACVGNTLSRAPCWSLVSREYILTLCSLCSVLSWANYSRPELLWVWCHKEAWGKLIIGVCEFSIQEQTSLSSVGRICRRFRSSTERSTLKPLIQIASCLEPWNTRKESVASWHPILHWLRLSFFSLKAWISCLNMFLGKQ